MGFKDPHRVAGLLALIASTAIMALLIFAAVSSAAQFSGSGAEWAGSLRTHAPGVPGQIDVELGGANPCPMAPAAGGCYDAGVVWAPVGDAFALEHELGHAFDERVLTRSERDWYTAAFGYHEGTTWAPDRGADAFCARIACPVERFADAYADCALGLYQAHYDPVHGTYEARLGRVVVPEIERGSWHPGALERAYVCARLWRDADATTGRSSLYETPAI